MRDAQDSALSHVWWRATQYELREGYLRPAAGARFKRYSPLDDHDEQRHQRADRNPAYLSLIRIAAGAHGGNAVQEAVVDWCNTYGLLGLLLHQVQQVRFVPRWKRRQPSSGEAGRRDAALLREARRLWPEGIEPNSNGNRDTDEKLYLTQAVYQRTNSGGLIWSSDWTEFHAGGVSAPKDAEPDQPADERFWSVARPGVILQQLSTADWREEPIDATWARFFPDVPETSRTTYAYPEPYSDEFWHLYAEPIQDFMTGAELLRRACFLASPKHFHRGRPKTDVVNDAIMSSGFPSLNTLVTPCGPMLVRYRRADEQRLTTTSLLGALVLMAQRDTVGSRRLLRCENEHCQTLFIGSNVQNAYCSPKCRYAHHALKKFRIRKAGRVGRRRSRGRG